MGKHHLLYAAALTLLWSPAVVASDQLEPLQAAPSVSAKGLQQKAAPTPLKLQPSKQLQQAPSTASPGKPPAAPKAGSGTLIQRAQPATPKVGLRALDQRTRSVAPGARPAGPAVVGQGEPRPGPGDQSPPDLLVSRLEYISDEFRFRVLNEGDGEKPPARVSYRLKVDYYDSENNLTGSKSHRAAAALTSLARLAPGEETGDDRVTGVNIPLRQRMRITLCINDPPIVAEQSYDNNCKTTTGGRLLPDLEIVRARFELAGRPPKKKKKKAWWKRAASATWDFVSSPVDFDTSGKNPNPGDDVVLTIRNNGSVPVSNFEVFVSLWKEDGSGSIQHSMTYTDILQPGQTGKASLRVRSSTDLRKNTSCCGGTAIVDLPEKVQETNEHNNKMSIDTVWVTDHR